MIEVTYIEEADDGFMLRWCNSNNLMEGGYVHLTAAWVDDFHTHQFKPYGLQCGPLNQLRFGFSAGTLTTETAGELFAAAYEQAAETAGDQRNKRRQRSGPLQDFIGSGRAKNR